MSDTPPATPERTTLRHLPLAARIAMSAFLISVGIGYTSALVQLHFQHAKPGQPMPGKEEVERVFASKPGVGAIERLLRADEHLPFNASGTMRPAFFRRSGGWPTAVRHKAEELKVDVGQADREVRKEREYEIEAILLWIKNGATEETYEDQVLPEGFFNGKAPDKKFFDKNKFFNKADDGKYHAVVSSIIENRCAKCHKKGEDGPAGEIHLENWQQVSDYVNDLRSGGGMSLTKLAQTTHVHLLGFSMLYGMTGLILAFSSYPGWLRLVLCPLPLIAQVVDITCWWLGRFDPIFAHFIIYTGGIVALGLMLHIVLSLLNMYGVAGKLVLLLMFVSAAGGGYFLKTGIIDPYLVRESSSMSIPAP